MRDGYGFILSEPRCTITYDIGWVLYDWNNGIRLRQNQHKRLHNTPMEIIYLKKIDWNFSEEIASLATMIATALSTLLWLARGIWRTGVMCTCIAFCWTRHILNTLVLYYSWFVFVTYDQISISIMLCCNNNLYIPDLLLKPMQLFKFNKLE